MLCLDAYQNLYINIAEKYKIMTLGAIIRQNKEKLKKNN